MKNGELSRDFDPHDPDCRMPSEKGGAAMVPDDSNNVVGSGVGSARENRIKSLEDRVEKLQAAIVLLGTHTGLSRVFDLCKNE